MGHRPRPSQKHLTSLLTDAPHTEQECQVQKEHVQSAPVLITAEAWCPFTLKANELWSEAAKDAGVKISFLDIDQQEGSATAKEHNVGGVPCMINAEGNLLYGLCSPEEAQTFLQGK